MNKHPSAAEISTMTARVALTAVAIETFNGRPVDDDELIELLAEQEAERDDDQILALRDEMARIRNCVLEESHVASPRAVRVFENRP